jgi:Xaa-Pro aminopeptidase
MSRALMPNMLTPQDLEPNWEWRDRLPGLGPHLRRFRTPDRP